VITAKLINHMGKDDTPAWSAWVSTGKDELPRTEEQVVNLIERLAKDKHFGCFEHNTASFEIECPIFIARQIMRHRTFSYNELSGRYKDFSDRDIYLSPELGPLDKKMIEGFNKRIRIMYINLRNSGYSKEVARLVLPLSTMTKFKMTGNLRNWAHFINLRLDPHAQEEVRIIARQVKEELETLWPVSTKNLLQNQ